MSNLIWTRNISANPEQEAKIREYKAWLERHPFREEELSPRFYEDEEKILFYHSDHWGCNFSKYSMPLSMLDPAWAGNACTTENIFQAAKFYRGNPEYALRIATAKTPSEAASLGRDRSVAGFDPEWDKISLGVMVEVLQVKVDLYPSVENALRATGKRILVENTALASYDDYVWGCGKKGNGRNLLGIGWMIVRDRIG